MKKVVILALLVLAGCDSSEPAPKAKPTAKASPKATPKPTPTETAKPTPTAAPAALNPKLLDPSDPEWKKESPAEFKVKFETSKGDFVVKVTRDLSPNGADRFYNLVRFGFYTDVRFFRNIPGFMVQFGMHGDPKVSQIWTVGMPDDPVKRPNARGTITFAKTGMPNSRSTQLFINFADNGAKLDGQGFAPFGEVVEGMPVVDSLNSEYGPAPGARQQEIRTEGNAFLDRNFPNLDYIKSARIME